MKYLQAMQQGKHEEVIALCDFRDQTDRQGFQESLKTFGAIRQWDLKRGLYVVRAERKNDHIWAVLLLPTTGGFLPQRFSLREIVGHMKLMPDKSKKHQERGVDFVSAAAAELKESLEGWRSAHGTALTEKVRVLKEQLEAEIDALEYARTKQLQDHSRIRGLSGAPQDI